MGGFGGRAVRAAALPFLGGPGYRILQWSVVIASTDIHIAVFKDTNYLKSLLLFGQPLLHSWQW